MRGEDRQNHPLDIERYLQSQISLRKLKAHLPVDKVEGLAKEVIRRVNAHQDLDTPSAPTEDEIAALCHALMSEDNEAGAAFIKDLRGAGATLTGVYLGYLAGAARMLGQWWEDDRVSLVDVTLGTSRIYAIMRALRDQLPVSDGPTDRRAFFASVPGETHTLGIVMATDLLRKDGWSIALKMGESHDDLISAIERTPARIIGLSAGGQHAVAALSKLVVAIRIRRPDAAVFVSGHSVAENPKALALMDLDGTASDMDGARELLDRLWARQVARHA